MRVVSYERQLEFVNKELNRINNKYKLYLKECDLPEENESFAFFILDDVDGLGLIGDYDIFVNKEEYNDTSYIQFKIYRWRRLYKYLRNIRIIFKPTYKNLCIKYFFIPLLEDILYEFI